MGASAKGKDDDPLGSTLQVSSSLLHGSEDRSGVCDSMEEPEDIALTEKIKSETDA